MKAYRTKGYVILINYETHDKLTDRLSFRIHCEFEKGKLTFASNSLNNIKRGRHKTEIDISRATKKEYGFLKRYQVDLYKNGVLVDSKKRY